MHGHEPESAESGRHTGPLGFEHSFAEALEGLYVDHTPAGFQRPKLLVLNRDLCQQLRLPELSDAEAASVFSGSRVPSDARPVAQAYAGHQFGNFVPQLGDGRALLLGEIVDEQKRRADIHLKGSGATAFSRGGDGKATLGPVLREYLIGEAMHHLGVPTTRVLAAVLTGETVRRERLLPGAVLARVAASHLRVGTLQFVAVRRDSDQLLRLVRYALKRHYPERASEENPAFSLLQAVAEAQARLIAHWMQIGFIHGVMNTDNTTLSGETIDYGPCAFMDSYDPETVFSSIDHGGRYAFGNQPAIGRWNLMQMGLALAPLLAASQEDAVERIRAALDLYENTFARAVRRGMQNKLGLRGDEDDDEALVMELLEWMQQNQQDYTLCFRRLAQGLVLGQPAFSDPAFLSWYARYQKRHEDEAATQVAARMDQHNPLYIPRNHLVEQALDAAIEGDLSPFTEMLEVLKRPFSEQPGRERYTEPAPPGFGPYQTFCGT